MTEEKKEVKIWKQKINVYLNDQKLDIEAFNIEMSADLDSCVETMIIELYTH